MRRVDDGVQLGNLIDDALERSFPISHAVQDAAEGPHVTFGTDLWEKRRETVFTNSSATRNDSSACLSPWVGSVPLSGLSLPGMRCL